MNKFILEPEEILPGICLDQEKGKLELYGKSCPIDAHSFYEPMQDWIDEYIENPNDSTILEINLNYFNTVSAKVILNILYKMEKLAELGKKVKIHWLYHENDQVLLEAGEDFNSILNVEFEFIALKSSNQSANDQEGIDHLIEDI